MRSFGRFDFLLVVGALALGGLAILLLVLAFSVLGRRRYRLAGILGLATATVGGLGWLGACLVALGGGRAGFDPADLLSPAAWAATLFPPSGVLLTATLLALPLAGMGILLNWEARESLRSLAREDRLLRCAGRNNAPTGGDGDRAARA